MSTEAKGGFTRTVPFWAGLAFGTFGAVMGLALSDAINAATALILMIVPAGLFFQTMRVANTATACSGRGEAQRLYVKRVAIFASTYLVVLALQVSLLGGDDASEASLAARAALSVMPGLAICGIFWAIGRLILDEKDEFIRMLIVRQTLIATGFALGFATIWGFLEAGEVVPHIPAYWFAVAFFGGQFIGAVSNRITHGSWGAL
ncbi:hypothetical protein K3163_01185 [Qipengyuania sp. 1NDW9]|uniref:Uncharacterized protein n=1 Tax=Qipengyuania xiapuensis TaxID=2867236 RepID=A0ABX8ZV59_9SPHN|nr:hypothetical protein [Qipengyuania xiapuensis]MBX7491816.1 hypothetical protein [Qipengyuania xiapuensis]QZD91477.1 hypothetical protein K3162_07785 [Qipengyuania xiapuensis]